jgi:L-fucose isomerase-like protein
MTGAARNANRVAEVIGAVARQALADRGVSRIALLDDGGPEARLALSILRGELGDDAVISIDTTDVDTEPLLRELTVDTRRIDEEVRRMRARLKDDALPAHPANKTALLLGGELPPEPLLPLGDLWATDVLALGGGWSASPEIERLAQDAGGIEALDGALRRLIDGRDASGLDALPAEVAARVRTMLQAGSAARRYPCIVPKLGGRTLFADLYE